MYPWRDCVCMIVRVCVTNSIDLTFNNKETSFNKTLPHSFSVSSVYLVFFGVDRQVDDPTNDTTAGNNSRKNHKNTF